MRLDRFDLNLLIVLDALLEERNVTKAALRLHIGQSAASGCLARLREYFGDELLVLVGRQLVPTPLAESLVEPVRDALMMARAAIARKPGFDPATVERRFLVSASDYVTTVLMAEVVRRVAELAPGIVIDIRNPQPDVFDIFERGNIDLLVMPEQYMSRFTTTKTKLFEDSQVCVVWTGNPLVGETLSFDEYMQLGHVTINLGDERSLAFEEWFLPSYGKQRRIEVSVDNFSVLPLVVVGTRRIATLHRKQAEFVARLFPLRLIATPFEMPPVVELMSWPRHLENDPTHQWLRQLISDCAQPGQAPACVLAVS
ncbi:MAG: LysR family transcriptional regulator [Pseudomonadota bacterium]